MKRSAPRYAAHAATRDDRGFFWFVRCCLLPIAFCLAVIGLMMIAEGDIEREVVISGRTVLLPSEPNVPSSAQARIEGGARE